MSNIKEIDGVFVNLDLVTEIIVWKKSMTVYNIQLWFPYVNEGYNIFASLEIEYKTKQEAEERIKQILKNQNSEEVKI